MEYTVFMATETVEHPFKTLIIIIAQTTVEPRVVFRYLLYRLPSIDHYENHDIVSRYPLHDSQSNTKTTVRDCLCAYDV